MKKSFSIFGVVIVFFLIIALIIPVKTLTVKKEDGKVLYSQLIKDGDRFTIRCIHSVEKTPVDETYEIINGDITLVETVYSDFGAGLPYRSFEGQKFTREPGKFRITGYDLLIPRLDIRVGRFADHAYIYGEKIIKLENWAEPGQAVSFTINNTNFINFLVKRWR